MNTINENKNKAPALKVLFFFILVICVAVLSYLKIEKDSSLKPGKASATRLDSELLEIISPADWKFKKTGNSFRFLHPDGSFIIMDSQKDEKYPFIPLDKNQSQNSILLTNLVSRYGISSSVKVTSTKPDKISKINALTFNISFGDGKKGTASIFYSNDWRFVYISGWTGQESSHSALICKNCRNFISVKKPFSTTLYMRPLINSSDFADNYEFIKKTEEHYTRAKQLWISANNNPNDIANSVKAFQKALSTLALCNSGGLIYESANKLFEDAKIAFQARVDKLEQMKSEVTQYIKIGDEEMAQKILDDLLSTASHENELSFKEWALNTKAGLKKTNDE